MMFIYIYESTGSVIEMIKKYKNNLNYSSIVENPQSTNVPVI